MVVKLRKSGNSYSLTVPSPYIQVLGIKGGQDMEVNIKNGHLEYRVADPRPADISWDRYTVPQSAYASIQPDQYEKELRNHDR